MSIWVREGAESGELKFGATISFQHYGKADTVWVGIGLAYGHEINIIVSIPTPGHSPPFVYAMAQVDVDNDDEFTEYIVDVEGTFPSSLETGKTLDAQHFISLEKPVAGQQPGNDFGLNKWADDVFNTGGGFGDILSMIMPIMMIGMMANMMSDS